MLYIYFDQFVISGLSNIKKTENWNKILDILFQLKKQNKICCCTSPETIFETSQRNSIGIDENYKLISELLDNCFLNDIEQIICQQIAKNIKGITSVHFLYPKYDFSSKELNNHLKSMLYSTFENIHIPTLPIECTHTNITKVTKILSENEIFSFIDSIKKFLSKEPSNSFYYIICKSLKDNFKFELGDFIKLQEDIYTNGFNMYPTLKIRSTLYPFIFFSEYTTRQNIKLKNDLIDIRRISSALPYCDIVFCDSRWKERIKSLEINKKEKLETLLFSGSSTDLNDFYMHLLNL